MMIKKSRQIKIPKYSFQKSITQIIKALKNKHDLSPMTLPWWSKTPMVLK